MRSHYLMKVIIILKKSKSTQPLTIEKYRCSCVRHPVSPRRSNFSWVRRRCLISNFSWRSPQWTSTLSSRLVWKRKRCLLCHFPSCNGFGPSWFCSRLPPRSRGLVDGRTQRSRNWWACPVEPCSTPPL